MKRNKKKSDKEVKFT